MIVKHHLLLFLNIITVIVVNEAAIQRRYSKKDLLTQREAAGVPNGDEAIQQLIIKSKEKRAAGDPKLSRSVLEDGHTVAQIKYSGRFNSEVSRINRNV